MPAPRGRTADVLELPVLASGLPLPPSPSLDPYLDAAARCLARHGIRRTSVQDVAAELRVNRATVYRQVGNVESMVRLLSARELHRLLESVYRRLDLTEGPESLVSLLAAVVDEVRSHPVVTKVLADERDVVGVALDDMPAVLDRITAAIVPPLRAAMAAGRLAPRNPEVVAGWVARIGAAVVLAPPPGDLAAFLRELLVPALDPGR